MKIFFDHRSGEILEALSRLDQRVTRVEEMVNEQRRENTLLDETLTATRQDIARLHGLVKDNFCDLLKHTLAEVEAKQVREIVEAGLASYRAGRTAPQALVVRRVRAAESSRKQREDHEDL